MHITNIHPSKRSEPRFADISREGAKFMGIPGRVYLYAGRHFFGWKKGAETFFGGKGKRENMFFEGNKPAYLYLFLSKIIGP